MEWIDPEEQLPPQGKKILYFDRGDIYVVQRFRNHWIPIPFTEKIFDTTKPPELWGDIFPPGNYEGLMKIYRDGKYMTIDEFESKYPDEFEETILKLFTSL